MSMETRIPLPVIVGPTASGKTDLAVQLAKQMNGEVVSADSMQIYQILQVGTARPTEEEMDGIPHHLMGFLPLNEAYSVAQYVEHAGAVIREIRSRRKQPILCGGTGLYVQSLIENIDFSVEAVSDPAYREELRFLAEEQGGQALWEHLNQVDPETAARLHPNDHGRLIRALELYHTSGMTMSEHNRRSRQNPSPYEPCVILLDFKERARLYERIDRRVEMMLQNGLLEEARLLLNTPHAPTAMQAIGYKELAPYFNGEISLKESVERIQQGTRRYAKRQLSWFRRMNVHTLYREDYADDTQSLAAAAFSQIQNTLSL